MAGYAFIENLKETLRQFQEEHATIAKAMRDVEALLASMSGGEPQKRRGRPPGKAATTTGKKRGRPPGSGKKGKKRRGRPPGSKNKVASTPMTGPKKQGSRAWTPEQREAAGARLAKARAARRAASDDPS